MGYYQKISVVVEAVRFAEDGSNVREVCDFCPYESFGPDVRLHPNGQLLMVTSHGRVWLNKGDWVLKQYVNGEPDCWPVTNDAFQSTYVQVRVPVREAVAS